MLRSQCVHLEHETLGGKTRSGSSLRIQLFLKAEGGCCLSYFPKDIERQTKKRDLWELNYCYFDQKHQAFRTATNKGVLF